MFGNRILHLFGINVFPILTVIPVLITFVLGIVFAYYVYKDASKIADPPLKIPPIIWALFVFSSIGIGLIAYWLINKSNLNRE